MIKIFVDNIELPIVSETLTLTNKNNIFSDAFSLDYSKHPFLVLENEDTVKALGSKHIVSLSKRIVYNVLVFKENKVYYGKLKVKSYIVGARKCDLVFGSELIKILDKKIADFMPTVYLDNGFKKPYTDTSTTDIPQDNLLKNLEYVEMKKYPEIDFQFPEFLDKDIVDSKEDIWLNYSGFLNFRNSQGRLKESLSNKVSYLKMEVANYTLFKPCVYLMSILKHVFSEISWKFKFDSNFDFLQRVLLIVANDNNCVFTPEKPKIEITTLSNTDFHYYESVISSESLGIGNYRLTYSFKSKKMDLNFQNNILFKISLDNNSGEEKDVFVINENIKRDKLDSEGRYSREGQMDFDITQENQVVKIIYSHILTAGISGVEPVNKYILPDDFKLTLMHNSINDSIVRFHPTIELSRFVPDWTVVQYFNNLKKLLNLKIDIDESIKTVSFNFTDKFITNHDIVDLTSYKLEQKSYSNNQSDVFKISYYNGEFAWIDEKGVSKKSIFEKDVVEIDNDFYTPEFNDLHHELTKDNLEGVGLVLNNSGTKNTISSFKGKNLKLASKDGIADVYWKNWVKFRRNSSNIVLVGNIKKQDLIRIEKYKKVYYYNIVFIVEKVTTKETNGFTETTLELHSKMF